MSEKDTSKYGIYRENLKDATDNYDNTRYELEHYGYGMAEEGLSDTLKKQENRMDTIKGLKSKLENKK